MSGARTRATRFLTAWIVAAWLAGAAAGPAAADTTERLRHWNHVAVDASGLDHTHPAPGEARVFGEQLGPTRSSRAMAVVHVAVFEAANAVEHRYDSYVGLPPAPPGCSADAAVAFAAHDSLAAMFPSQGPALNARLAEDLVRIPDGLPKLTGAALGRRAAAAVLALRAHDGSDRPEPRVGVEFLTGVLPGQWRQDPVSRHPLAFGAYWGGVRPFVLPSPLPFRAPPPPGLKSPEYAAAFAGPCSACWFCFLAFFLPSAGQGLAERTRI